MSRKDINPEEYITEWNATGCRGVKARWGLTHMQAHRLTRQLRSEGHELTDSRGSGRPVVRRHVDVSAMCSTRTIKEVAEKTGLTYHQVSHSCRATYGDRRPKAKEYAK
jgi:hypothetical protein